VVDTVALVDDQPVTGAVPTPVATAAATLEAVVPMAGGKIVNQGFPCASPTSIMHALLFTFVECVPYNADQAPDLDFFSHLQIPSGCHYAHLSSSVFSRTLRCSHDIMCCLVALCLA